MAKPDNVTEQGRKKDKPELPAKMTSENSDERITKPWKSEKDKFALALLQWIVTSLQEKSTERVWPLLVPPILTLVDDWETQYKRLGAELLHSLLRATSPTLLSRTGLGSVFEDALMPCLTYLPSLTPESDSSAILSVTYPALLTLTHTRFPTTNPNNPKDPNRQNRIKAYDAILRKGVLHAYAHCGQYPDITRVLFTNLTILLNEMGIDSVKHLQYVLPMLSEALTQAAKAQQADLLVITSQAVQAVIFNAWPRMMEHRVEIVKGLAIAWLTLVESGVSGSDGFADVKGTMVEALKVLHAAMGEKEWFVDECSQYLEADGNLVALLGWATELES